MILLTRCECRLRLLRHRCLPFPSIDDTLSHGFVLALASHHSNREETSSVGTTKDYVHEKKVKYAYILPEAFIEYADDKLPDYDKMDALFWCTMSYNYKHCSASTDQRRLMKISKRASSDTESSTDEEAEDAEDDDFEAGENVEEEIDVVMK